MSIPSTKNENEHHRKGVSGWQRINMTKKESGSFWLLLRYVYLPLVIFALHPPAPS